jgi:hypothetical protein
MPTGNTWIIEEKKDVTLRDYAFRCARVSFPESSDSPSRHVVSGRWLNAEREARQELDRLLSLSPEARAALAMSEAVAMSASNEQLAVKHAAKQAAYAKMRAEVVAWEPPPTPAHANLKAFMLAQIDLSYNPTSRPFFNEFQGTVQWFEDRVASLRGDVARAAERHAAEVAEVAQYNAWLDALDASLPRGDVAATAAPLTTADQPVAAREDDDPMARIDLDLDDLLKAAHRDLHEHNFATPNVVGAINAVPKLAEALREALAERDEARALLEAPEIADFVEGVRREAAHQRTRWDANGDAGKTPADWFWLIGYLAGKALHAQVSGNITKALHHTISTAAALCNWHAAILGKTDMRPGPGEEMAVAAGVEP